MKIIMTEPRRAPMVRSTAMSDCFSVTVITSDETSPNAPTSTMRKRMIAIMRFSTCTAANHVRFCCVQSVAYWPRGRMPAIRRATAGASPMSATLMRSPAGPPVL